MNKSIEFIANQIKVNQVAENFPRENWTEENANLYIMDFFEVLKYALSKYDYDNMIVKNKLSATVKDEDKNSTREVVAKIDSEAEYEYFISRQTVIPITEETMDISQTVFNLAFQLFQEIGTGRTYYINKHPKNYTENYYNYNLKYTLGELLVKVEEIQDYTNPNNSSENQKEEVFQGRLLTVVLPVAIKYSKQKKQEEVINNEQ